MSDEELHCCSQKIRLERMADELLKEAFEKGYCTLAGDVPAQPADQPAKLTTRAKLTTQQNQDAQILYIIIKYY